MNPTAEIVSDKEWFAWNSDVFDGRAMDRAVWESLKRQVDETLEMIDIPGTKIIRMMFVNEVNEVTPNNADRNQFFFRIIATRDGSEGWRSLGLTDARFQDWHTP